VTDFHTSVIPYVEPKDEKAGEFGSTLTSTLPMAAVSPGSRQVPFRNGWHVQMFTRNKMIGW